MPMIVTTVLVRFCFSEAKVTLLKTSSADHLIFCDFSVVNGDNAVRLKSNAFVMGDDNERLPVFLVGNLEKVYDLSAVLESRFPVGSSASTTAGAFIRARPMDTLCC